MEREKANKTIEVWQSTCRQGQEKEGGNTPSGQDGAPSPLPQTGNALLVIGKELPGLGSSGLSRAAARSQLPDLRLRHAELSGVITALH